MKHLIFVKAKFPQPHNAFGSYFSSLFLFIITIVLLPSHSQAQKTYNWEVGTSFGFSIGNVGDKLNVPGIGEMTTQSDLWYPGVRLAYRRFSNKEWPSLSLIAEYQRNRVSLDRLITAETLGVTREQTDLLAHAHYLSIGSKLDLNIYQKANNTFLLGLGLSYMTNFINEAEIMRTRQRALAEPDIDKYYIRENRFDDDTEDFTADPYVIFSIHTAYERYYERIGYRFLVELNFAHQRIESTYNVESNNNRFLKVGAAILL